MKVVTKIVYADVTPEEIEVSKLTNKAPEYEEKTKGVVFDTDNVEYAMEAQGNTTYIKLLTQDFIIDMPWEEYVKFD